MGRLEEGAEAEGGVELAGRSESKGVEVHAAASADVGEDVVDVENACGRGACSVDGGPVDLWLRFAGSNAAGIDARGEVTKESEVGFQMSDVNGIGVGEKDQPIAAREARKKMIGEDRIGKDDAVPGLAKLIEGDAEVEFVGEMSAPIARCEAAFLPIFPERIALNGGPDFFRGVHFI